MKKIDSAACIYVVSIGAVGLNFTSPCWRLLLRGARDLVGRVLHRLRAGLCIGSLLLFSRFKEVISMSLLHKRYRDSTTPDIMA